MTKLIYTEEEKAAPPDPTIVFTDEFIRTMNLMENTRQHIFITGKAGVGKSTLLREWCRTTSKNYAIVAPTGIAAINAGGSTIHRYLSYKPNRPIEEIRRFPPRRRLEGLDTLIIDEMSMVRADLMDAIHEILYHFGPVKQTPFGSVQLIMIGDLCQLPPVVTSTEKEIYSGLVYESPYFFSANCWQQNDFTPVELSQIFRQADPLFIDILNQVRQGALAKGCEKLLQNRCGRDWQDGQIKLVGRNDMMNKINQEELDKLDTLPCIIKAGIDGDFPERDAPNAINLVLKEGARVMFIANDPDGRWVNGDFGTVIDIDASHVYVCKDGNKFPYEVKRYEWPIEENYYDHDMKKTRTRKKGSFIQYPLKPAWAITIHKSQGQTFDKVCIYLKGLFAPGQAYVALSRCRSLEGLSLVDFNYVRKLYPDPIVRRFYTGINKRMNEAFDDEPLH